MSYIIFYRRPQSDEVRHRWASNMPEVATLGMALLSRGDELVHVSGTKDAFPLDVSWMLSAKRNRDRYIREGVRYEPLPALVGD
jgi:hypothetical protein